MLSYFYHVESRRQMQSTPISLLAFVSTAVALLLGGA